jgi:hypothetical protein
MMSKKQTAVEWLEKEIKSYIEYPIPIRSYSQIFYWFYQAKQKEKEQMYEFWLNGMKCDSGEGPSFDKYMEIKYEGKI